LSFADVSKVRLGQGLVQISGMCVAGFIRSASP